MTGDELRSRMTPYLDQWEAASAKLSAGEYHADDLLDDWFRFVGRMAKDLTAVTALLVESAGSSPGGSEPVDD